MKETYEIRPNSYYLFESLSSGRSCFFESEKELQIFKKLFNRYIGPYVKVHKFFTSSEGYQILLKVRGKEVLERIYTYSCERKGRIPKQLFIEEKWRIISEQMRIFHSVYVKCVNKIRDRKGVLVQHRYKRYYFDTITEYENYIDEMERGKEVAGQKNVKYRVSQRWIDLVRWGVIRRVEWGESAVNNDFDKYVVSKLIISTKKHQFSQIPP